MNFERIFDRKKSGSVKWNKYPESVIPMWVADMDFEVAKPIQKALQNYLDTSIYGYAGPSEDLANAIIERFDRLYNWKIERDWIVWTPSVVSSFYVCARMGTKAQSEVMTSVPVYHPFLDAASSNNRSLKAVDLKLEDELWTMDFEAMEKAVSENTEVYLLCNPHNPTGKMYSEKELLKLVDFCKKHDTLLCSDEIHADIILDENKKHIPVASLSEEAAMQTISLFSPGKAYNMPSLGAGFAIIPNEKLRASFERGKFNIVPNMTKLAGDVALAAYVESENWLKDCNAYLNENYQYLMKEINAIPGLVMRPMEATYLAWIDYSQLEIESFAQHLEKHGVGVIEGTQFMGKKHIRLNFGTQKSVLEEAVLRIKKAVQAL